MDTGPRVREGCAASRWAEVRALVEAALVLPTTARNTFLDGACSGDAGLRREVDAQVTACERVEQAADFLVDSAAKFAAPLLSAERTAPVRGGPGAPAGDAATGALGPLGLLNGRYALERELGLGGTATVYLARDLLHGRHVAVKILNQEFGAALSGERFLREIRVTAGLMHPHILPLHDSGEWAGALYYVMPFVDGETLRDRLAKGGPLPAGQVVRLLREIVSALACAHRQGLVHRDIKPANILLADGHAVLADFGIARALHEARDAAASADAPQTPTPEVGQAHSLTGAGISPGTPAYMAPEQVRGAPDVDHRVDLFALGVVTYEILTGEHPFGPLPRDPLDSARFERVPLPLGQRRSDIPPALATLIHQFLSIAPTERPDSAEAVLRTLDAFAPIPLGMAGRVTMEPSSTSGRRRGQRHGARALAGWAALLALVLGWGGYALTHTLRPPHRGTTDPGAYEAYLTGHYEFLIRDERSLRQAITSFERAIALDPQFARAYAGLAQAYSVLAVYTPIPGDSVTMLVEANARRALDLDSTLAEAHLAMGSAMDLALRFPEALLHYRAATTLDPASATGHHWLGMELLTLGQFDEALVALHRATQLDPMAVSAASGVALAYLYARRIPEALDAARNAMARDSTHLIAIMAMGEVQTIAGQPDSAVATLERGLRLHPGNSRLAADLVFAYFLAGRQDDAARLRARLHADDGDSTAAVDPALADLAFGDRKPLIRILSSPDGAHRYLIAGRVLGCHPFLDPLWTDMQFRSAMRDLGIPPCPAVS